LVSEPVRGGTELFYALGQNDNNDGLHGATANPTTNQLRRNASMEVLDSIQQHINAAYKPSTNAANGGLAQYTEGGVEMLPALLAGGKAIGAGGVQKGLAFAQMGAQAFAGSYDTIYQTALRQGMTDEQASKAAVLGGLTDAAVNTYLMKFGAIGQAAEGPAVRRVLGLALKDALAQGGVGLASGSVNEVTKFLATGESAQVENVLHTALQNAAAGVGFGLVRGATEAPPKAAEKAKLPTAPAETEGPSLRQQQNPAAFPTDFATRAEAEKAAQSYGGDVETVPGGIVVTDGGRVVKGGFADEASAHEFADGYGASVENRPESYRIKAPPEQPAATTQAEPSQAKPAPSPESVNVGGKSIPVPDPAAVQNATVSDRTPLLDKANGQVTASTTATAPARPGRSTSPARRTKPCTRRRPRGRGRWADRGQVRSWTGRTATRRTPSPSQGQGHCASGSRHCTTRPARHRADPRTEGRCE
jgi:hypothetical protein